MRVVAWCATLALAASASAGCGDDGAASGDPGGGTALTAGVSTGSGDDVTSGDPAGGTAAEGVGGASSGSGTGAGGNGTSAGGGGGSAPVTPCPSDGEEIGAWIDITPPDMPVNDPATNNGAGAFVIDPADSSTIYLGSDKRGIFKTTDCGATWELVSTGRNGDLVGSGGQWAMAMDDAGNLYSNSGYGANGLWRSSNGGVDWESLFPTEVAEVVPDGGFIERIRTDMTNSAHVVVSFHRDCAAPYDPECAAESFDAGETWDLLTWAPVNEEDAGHFVLDENTWLFTSLNGPIWRTADAGATWAIAYEGGASDSLYITADGTFYMGVGGGVGGVLRSVDQGASWTLIQSAPVIRDIVGDGTTLFATNKLCEAPPDCEPYFSAPESDPESWAPYPAPAGLTRGGWMLRYDEDHHLLYSSNEFGGFWRVRTK
jgi:hypothetical protein